MKLYVISIIFCSALYINYSKCGILQENSDHNEEQDENFLRSTAGEHPKLSGSFETDLYNEIIKDQNKSLIFSPISIQTALSLAMFGTNGETREQLKFGMRLNQFTDEKILHKFKKLSNKVKADHNIKIANKIYIPQGHSIKPSFKAIAEKNFNSEAQNIDFKNPEESADIINKWVENYTNNKIRNLISSEALAESKMVLVNAIYFKGAWEEKFDYRRTLKKKFYFSEDKNVMVDMMAIQVVIILFNCVKFYFNNSQDRYRFGEIDELNSKVIEIPYKDSDISMMIILPNKNDRLSTLESKIDKTKLGNLSKKLNSQEVILEIPKFKIEFEINMNEPLIKVNCYNLLNKNRFTFRSSNICF